MQLTICLVPTTGERNTETAPNFWSQKFSHFRSSFWPKQGSGTIIQGLSGSITLSWQKTRTPSPAKRRFSDAWLAQSWDRSPESTFRTTAVLLQYNQLGSPPPNTSWAARWVPPQQVLKHVPWLETNLNRGSWKRSGISMETSYLVQLVVSGKNLTETQIPRLGVSFSDSDRAFCNSF